MHVLITANNVFPDPEAGGSGRYIHEVGKRLVERDHEVTVLTRRRGNTSRHDRLSGMDIYRYDGSITSLPVAVNRMRKWCEDIHRKNSVDICNFHGPFSSFLADHLLPNEIPRIYTFHGPWPAEYCQRQRDQFRPVVEIGGRIRLLIERNAMRNVNKTITLSEFMRSRLEEHYPDTSSGPVIPGGVDVDRFSPKEADESLFDCEGTSFLTVRRLTPRMGIETLIDEFQQVVDQNPNSHLYIAGDGPLRSSLEQRVRNNEIDSNITFLGYVPESELATIYASADVFVLPTIALEGFGLATLEALSSGTPVVGTSVGGTSEILTSLETPSQDVPRYLVDEANNLGDCLADWDHCSSSTIELAGRTAREYVVSEYTWEQIVHEIIDVFKDCIKE